MCLLYIFIYLVYQINHNKLEFNTETEIIKCDIIVLFLLHYIFFLLLKSHYIYITEFKKGNCDFLSLYSDFFSEL